MTYELLAHTATDASPWAWRAHPEVWMLVSFSALVYWWVITRVGPRHVRPGEPLVTRRQVLCFAGGVGAIWAFADWPVHEISEGYLFSVHMVQHLVFTLVAPPLLLVGLPQWLHRLILSPPRLAAVVQVVTKPLPASLAFNALVVLTHTPPVVNASLGSELFHFMAHLVLFTSAMCMWFPVFNKVAGFPMLSPAFRMIYLFLQSVIPTGPASFITFAESPMYKAYFDAPRAFGINVVADQQAAGAFMKILGGALLWGMITVMFFRWYASEQRDKNADVLTLDDVQQEFGRTPAPTEPAARSMKTAPATDVPGVGEARG